MMNGQSTKKINDYYTKINCQKVRNEAKLVMPTNKRRSTVIQMNDIFI